MIFARGLIFEVDKTLIVVSCKSILYTENYDLGDFKSIRNIQTSLEKYIEDWHKKVDILNKNKKGANYDFSNYTQILGLVVTPNVLFISTNYYKEIGISGLFTHMSLKELEDWLSI